jgi:predicted permease
LLPADASNTLHFQLQPSVIVFAGVMAIGTGLLFGLFPALHSTRADLISSIRAGAGQIAGGRAASRFRASLVTLQIALSMALLTSAGLFLKSLNNVSKVDLGLNVDNMTTFGLSPRTSGFDTTRSAILFNRVEQELKAIPGVTAVSSSIIPLLAGSNWGTDMRVQGFESGPDIDSNARYNEVGANYFTMLGVKFIAGRDFTPSDIAGSSRVAIVNQTFARKFKMGDQVVGKFMSFGGDSLDTQIVGYIEDAKYSDVKDTVPPLAYIPWRQDTRAGNMSFYVKSSLPPEQIVRAILPLMKKVEPLVPVEDLKTMSQQVKDNIFLDRMISTLSAAFAILATLLASVGLYGVLAYTVSQRTREIGVRMALGAEARHVRTLVLKQLGGMLIIGGAIGVLGAYGLGKGAKSLLFGLEGHDPMVFVLSIVLLSIIAMSAGYLPSRRAVKVDPMRALRYD